MVIERNEKPRVAALTNGANISPGTVFEGRINMAFSVYLKAGEWIIDLADPTRMWLTNRVKDYNSFHVIGVHGFRPLKAKLVVEGDA